MTLSRTFSTSRIRRIEILADNVIADVGQVVAI